MANGNTRRSIFFSYRAHFTENVYTSIEQCHILTLTYWVLCDVAVCVCVASAISQLIFSISFHLVVFFFFCSSHFNFIRSFVIRDCLLSLAIVPVWRSSVHIRSLFIYFDTLLGKQQIFGVVILRISCFTCSPVWGQHSLKRIPSTFMGNVFISSLSKYPKLSIRFSLNHHLRTCSNVLVWLYSRRQTNTAISSRGCFGWFGINSFPMNVLRIHCWWVIDTKKTWASRYCFDAAPSKI